MKGRSGLFKNTLGYRIHQEHSVIYSQRAQNHLHVCKWAEELTTQLSAISPTQRGKFNTACAAYDESTGTYYYGRNHGIDKNQTPKNPIIFGDSSHTGILPSVSLNGYRIGNCAEVDAINNALNAGAKLENLHISTIHTTASSFGKPKESCLNCTYSFKGKVKRNYTGWFKEKK